MEQSGNWLGAGGKAEMGLELPKVGAIGVRLFMLYPRMGQAIHLVRGCAAASHPTSPNSDPDVSAM